MKKAALTFGLFSLVMVATSFANPVQTNNTITIVPLGTDGTGGQQGPLGPGKKKVDDFTGTNQSVLKLNQSSSFGTDSQSSSRAIKLD
ncbi:hypothetical protein GKZ90_0016180 [Flavobacterium sp. MC2016-06]|jgi:uncharacterized protein YccT (UPF0319 family)|uniref:hypothetical protein n=1 Tax=Flavobacterium sp. MC2016-06 TaxID=2676308 RepID=UPI0012BAC28C|nr:hypothetical protein [Flavobacterium sp. MC2016-06]MBU3860092.1 hypothetical protein [Flavobacterium sp. MC2016-06]